MTSRREFIGGAVGLAAAAVLAAKIVTEPREDYRPVGHIKAGWAIAADVDYVTLNGERVDHVFELDDVAGWLRLWVVPSPRLFTWHTQPPAEYRTGVVRVYWKARS